MTARSTSVPGEVAPRGTLIGLFHDRDRAERAIRELQAAGFASRDIGVVARDRNVAGELAEESGTKAGEGAAAGAVSGGVLGGIIGLLIGAGALAIPGIGPVIAGGALASAFGVAGGTAVAGAGIGAASGGVLGALIGLGIPEEEATYFDRGFREGGILVTVNAGARLMEARDILEDSGADVGPTYGSAGSRRPYATMGTEVAPERLGVGTAGEASTERRRPNYPGRRRTDQLPGIDASLR